MERLTHPRSNGIKTGYWSSNKKDELIERLAEYEDTGLTPDEIFCVQKGNDNFIKYQKKLIERLYKALEKERKKHAWIPVEERLTENPYKLVLVQVSGSPNENISLSDAFELATYSPDDGWILEEYPEWEDAHPVAWKPLPKPYRKEE